MSKKRSQLNETLISLIERNEDESWLETFYTLREGKHLPQGGAGSLNDWEPTFSGIKKDIWYRNLYKFLREIENTEDINSKLVDIKAKREVWKNYIRECETCNKYQIHPKRFEKILSDEFYYNNLERLINKEELINSLRQENSFNNEQVNMLRKELRVKLIENNIELFDHRKSYVQCPHCEEEVTNLNTNSHLKIEIKDKRVIKFEILKDN